ncbi:unnamed protein product [Sphagnum jensenii]|uniref:E3 ubiquitin-protein ligase n=1 Tax=Sphagnum jensenii TaxID=128206 RepID=A0ABP0VB29_9BRYO
MSRKSFTSFCRSQEAQWSSALAVGPDSLNTIEKGSTGEFVGNEGGPHAGLVEDEAGRSGDPEAWSKSGNCCDHGGVSDEEVLKPSLDPVNTVPPQLLRGLRAVLYGSIGTIISHVTCVVRGYQSYPSNPFVKWCESFEIQLVGRLHDDEIHSYDDVTRCLEAMGLSAEKARMLTESVDKAGEATVFESSSLDELATHSATANRENLLLSLIPKDILKLEPNILAAFNWFQNIGNGGHAGLRSAITEILMKNVVEFPAYASVMETEEDGDRELKACVDSVAPNNIFALADQFPSIIPALCQDPSNVKKKGDELTIYWSEAIAQFSDPFAKTPRIAFALFMMASPFLSKPLRNSLNSLVMYFQHDNYFKFSFSQLFMLLYPSLFSLYLRFKRRISIHVERENEKWSVAINLLLEAEGITTDLISHAFFPFISSNVAWGYTTASASPGKIVASASSESSDATVAMDQQYSISVLLKSGLLHSLKKVIHIIDFYFCTSAKEIDSTGPGSTSSSTLSAKEPRSLLAGAKDIFTKFTSSTSFLRSNSSGASQDFGFTTTQTTDNLTELINRRKAKEEKNEDDDDDDDDRLYMSSSQPINFFSHVLVFPGVRNYRVSYNSVSLNIPLQRLVSKLFYYASMGGLDIQEAIEYLRKEAPRAAVNKIPDYPLRCLAFVAQVDAHMWRKNGSAAANLAFNYNRPIFSKTLRNADIHAVQVSVLALGPDPVLALALDRFELCEVLDRKNYFSSYDLLKEYKGDLLAEFFKTLSNILLYVPSILIDYANGNREDIKTPYQIETLNLAVAREVVHHVLVGEAFREEATHQVSTRPVTFGKLIRVKNIVATQKHVTEAIIKEVVNEYCTQRKSTYDEEEVPGLELNEKGYALIDPTFGSWSEEDQQKASETLREHLKRAENAAKSKSTVYYPALAFSAIPIAHPSFESVRSLLYRPLFFTVLEKALQVCTLKSNLLNGLGKSMPKIIGQVLQLITLQIHCVPLFSSMSSNVSVSNIINDSEDVYVNYASLYFSHAFKVSQTEYQITGKCYDGCGSGLLILLIEIWNSEVIKDDEIYQSALGWILQQLSQKSEDAKNSLESSGISFIDKSEPDDKNKKSLAQKKAAAQQKAMAAMSKQAKTFSNALDSDSDDEDKNFMNLDSKRHSKKSDPTLEDGASECIVCRDKCNDVMGYLCYIQQSKVLKNSIIQSMNDPAVRYLKSVYRVVSVNGCDVYTEPYDTGHSVSHLNQGDHVIKKQRVGCWIQIENPAGWVPVFTTNPDYASDLVNVSSPCITHLYPVINMAFNKHGDTRVHGERACPFCKGICNSLLPHTPPHLVGLYKTESSVITEVSSEQDTGSRSDELVKFLFEGTKSDISPTQRRNESKAALLGCLSKWIVKSKILDGSTSLISSSSLIQEIEKFALDISAQYHVPWIAATSESYYDVLEDVVPVKKLRTLHLLWASTAYTILSNVCSNNLNHQDVDPNSKVEIAYHPMSEAEAKDWKSYKIASHLLSSNQQLVKEMVSTSYELYESTAESLHLLLSGSPSKLLESMHLSEESESLKDICAGILDKYLSKKTSFLKLMTTLPYFSVGTHVMPSTRRLSMILGLFYEMQVCNADVLWAFLSIPLLAHDLHIVTVAAATIATDLQSMSNLCGLISVARLTQCLIEPACTGVYPLNKSLHDHESELKRQKSEPVLDGKYGLLISHLYNLRSKLCEEIDISIQPQAISNAALLEYALESWIVFLEFVVGIKYRMFESSGKRAETVTPIGQEATVGESATSPAEEKLNRLLGRVDSVLHHLGLSSFQDLLASGGLTSMALSWASQYRLSFSFLAKYSPDKGDHLSGQKNNSSAEKMPSQPLTPTLHDESNIETNRDNRRMVLEEVITHYSQLILVNTNYCLEDMDNADLNPAVVGQDLNLFLQQLGFAQNPDNNHVEDLIAYLQPPAATSAAKKHVPWRLVGVDPVNPYIDDHPEVNEKFSIRELNHLHAVTPFQSSITAGRRSDDGPGITNPGECTLHARECSGGTGVFFLVQHLFVLFVHRSYASYYPSIYLDSNEETDRSNQNRPMFLSVKRYKKVEEIYANHSIPLEVTRNRTTKQSFIRLAWY